MPETGDRHQGKRRPLQGTVLAHRAGMNHERALVIGSIGSGKKSVELVFGILDEVDKIDEHSCVHI